MENKPEKDDAMSRWRGPKDLANRKGRPKGSKNKNTQEVREAYQNLVEMNLENMSTWLAAVAADSPEKAFDLVIKLSEFVLPKISRMELTGKDGSDVFENLKFEFGPSVSDRMDSIDGIETIEPLDD